MIDKVIFLDIDGPLCNYRTHVGINGLGGGIFNDFDIYTVKILHLICDTGVRIVMSTSWRNIIYNKMMSNLETHDLIQYLYPGDFVTPDFIRSQRILENTCRGDEIQAWLDKHPDVTDFRIIDDDSDMLDHQKDKLILVNQLDGLSFLDYEKLFKWVGLSK